MSRGVRGSLCALSLMALAACGGQDTAASDAASEEGAARSAGEVDGGAAADADRPSGPVEQPQPIGQAGAGGDPPPADGGGADVGAAIDAGVASASGRTLSPCISRGAAPGSCEELCGALGGSCDSGGCPAAGALDSTALFYSSLAGCEDNAPVLTELAACDSGFGTALALSPFPIAYLRCCCEGVPDGAVADEPGAAVTLCERTCSEAEPDFSSSPECAGAAFCEERCEEALLGTGGECARCIAESIIWEAGSCNDFECHCVPPGFEGPDSARCAPVCLLSGG